MPSQNKTLGLGHQLPARKVRGTPLPAGARQRSLENYSEPSQVA